MRISELFETLMNSPCRSYEKLGGGRTNDSYMVIAEDGERYVLRVPGKGTNEYINRQDEIYNLKQVVHLDFVPVLCYANPDTGILVTKYIEDSRPLTREDMNDPQKVREVCEILVKLHTSGLQMRNEFDLIGTKNHYLKVLDSMGVDLPDALKEQMPMLESMMDKLFQEYPKKLVPCHGDINVENFLLSSSKMWLIDWEYSGMGNVYFELANMNLTMGFVEDVETSFLEGYQRCSGEKIDKKQYVLYKIATDYMWIFWHLIKLYQNQMVEYNAASWKKRLERACNHAANWEMIL